MKYVQEDISTLKSQKFWSLIKCIVVMAFLLLGLMIWNSTGDAMNAWIYAGIGGIPSAFKSTRRSAREKAADEIQDRFEPENSLFNMFARLLIRLVIIIIFAPVAACFLAISNLVKWIQSGNKLKETERIYNRMLQGDETPSDEVEAPVYEQLVQPAPVEDCNRYQPQPQTPVMPAAPVSPQVPVEQPVVIPQITQSVPPQQQSAAVGEPSKSNTGLIIGIVVGILFLVGGILTYLMWYVPYAKDRDALRTYVVATNVFLRSSEVAGVEYNILGKVPYGSELITYNINNEWAQVKVRGQEGYVASSYLLKAHDFSLLNGVWGDADSKECILSSKCRLAILNFYKDSQLSSGTNGWQIYTKQKDQKPNTVYYPRIFNKNSKYTDFIFIVKNNATGERILACYSFADETELPIFRFKLGAPAEGYIRNVSLSWNVVKVVFDNGKTLDITL